MVSSKQYMKYLPVSNRDRAWGTYILSSGLNRVAPESHYPILHLAGYSWQWESGRTLDDFQVLLLLEGDGEFESIPSGCLPLGAGDVILLFPGVWHRYRPARRTGWTEHWITFNGDFPQTLLKRGLLSPRNPVARTGCDPLVLGLFEMMGDLLLAESVGYQQVASVRLLELFAVMDASARRRSIGDSRIEHKVRQACAVMANHLHGPLRMPELADSLNLGYSWFRRMFKECTGHAPAQYHLQMRINHAKHLLLETNLSVKEIAARLGFDTPNHFSNTFKGIVGLGPSAFRLRAAGG